MVPRWFRIYLDLDVARALQREAKAANRSARQQLLQVLRRALLGEED